MWCPKIIYVHLAKSGMGVSTPLLDLYFNADALGSHCPKWLSGSSILCQSIQFRLNQAYGKSPIDSFYKSEDDPAKMDNLYKLFGRYMTSKVPFSHEM